jgi:hypothetical protein
MSGQGDCDVYDTSGKRLAQLTYSNNDLSYPFGGTLFGGNWYIANGGKFDILVYTQGSSPQYVETLEDYAGYDPASVAVYGKNGKVNLIAVANNAGPSGPGDAVVYEGTATYPSYALSLPSGDLRVEGIAFDSSGDCALSYGLYATRGNHHVLLYKNCTGNYTPVTIAHLGFPGGIVFDQHDNLIVVDQDRGVRICTGTSGCKVGIRGRGFFAAALNGAGTDLWVTNLNTGEISDYAYPSLTLTSKFRPGHGKSDPTYGIAAS